MLGDSKCNGIKGEVNLDQDWGIRITRVGQVSVLSRMVRVGHFKERFRIWLEGCDYVEK